MGNVVSVAKHLAKSGKSWTLPGMRRSHSTTFCGMIGSLREGVGSSSWSRVSTIFE
eukprot:CAMPEP_0198649182 /NCGR_PEP_ID=MMETSP1467-20131203/4070_1 /TAXON_ID=1462469 /ORGANISM="unid. sp., Strain CCMP2135" /LENGTH=55 /DNA_ID=CAMNT_0044384947 /DNA_START=8 /DNA_END=175 /DNA_ORIENTATION=-